MAAVPNKKNAAAKGAKAVREDQIAAKAIPGRVTSIDFESFNTPTAQAIVNEAAPAAVTPIAPPGVQQSAAAGALTANAILRDSVALAEGRPVDTGGNPNWADEPATGSPILQKAIKTSAAVAKAPSGSGRAIDTSFGRNYRSTGFQSVSKGPGRSYSFNEMLSLTPPNESLFRLADGSLDITEASRAAARNNLKKPVSLADVEAGRAIAEQVQQGTPVAEVVPAVAANPIQDLQRRFQDLAEANGGTFRPTPEMIRLSRQVDEARSQQQAARRQASSIRDSLDWLKDDNGGVTDPPTPAMERGSQRYQELSGQGGSLTDSSSYTDPSTPQGQSAARAAAASGGMGAAGGGEGGGGGRTPPPRNPNDFNPGRPDRPNPPTLPVARLAGEVQLEPGLWNHLKAGWRAQAGDANYSDSVIGDTFRGRKFPEQANSSIADKALYLGGRIGADVVGYGTRKGFWNMNPEDALGTVAREGANWAGLNGREAQLARYATATTVGLASANYNPFNFGEGGRPTGFGAVNPTDEDPRKTDNPIGELLFDRAMLGRTGRLLPWQEFHEERPDVSYEKYAKYQDYIRGPSFLGLAKGTMDGIDGPEARVVGYRVQPEAILAAAAAGAATIAAFKYGGKRL